MILGSFSEIHSSYLKTDINSIDYFDAKESLCFRPELKTAKVQEYYINFLTKTPTIFI